MPVLATDSETAALQLIWMGTLALGALSITVMAILIVMRIISESRNKSILARKQELTRYFYAALKSPIPLTAESLPKIKPSDYPLIMRTALDMLRTLRGDGVAQIMRVVALWNLSAYLYKTAASGRKGKRIQALTLLGYSSDDDSLKILLQHAASDDIYVQLSALRGLTARGAVEHIPYMVDCLTRSGQTNSLMLSDTLQRLGVVAVPSLLKLAQSNAHTEVRIAALLALSSIGAIQAVDGLLAMTDELDAEVRAQVIATLGALKDERAADIVAAHLQDDAVPVRIQSAQALGHFRVLRTLPNLVAGLTDQNWWVRFRTAEAIHKFGDRGIALLNAVAGEATDAGLIARQVLGERAGTA